MKTIQCDLCKRILGKQVDVGSWTSITTTEYKPNDFHGGFSMPSASMVRVADVCSECTNKVIEAQNKAIEEIKANIKV